MSGSSAKDVSCHGDMEVVVTDDKGICVNFDSGNKD